jgi:serine/threonine kinase 16
MHHYRLPSVPISSPSQPLAYPPKPSPAPLEGDTGDSSMPLMTHGEDEVVFDGDEELGSSDRGELVPYAHRDIKPA